MSISHKNSSIRIEWEIVTPLSISYDNYRRPRWDASAAIGDERKNSLPTVALKKL